MLLVSLFSISTSVPCACGDTCIVEGDIAGICDAGGACSIDNLNPGCIVVDIRIPCSTPVFVTVTVKDTWCKDSHPFDFTDKKLGSPSSYASREAYDRALRFFASFLPAGFADSGDSLEPVAHISPTVVYTHDGGLPAWGMFATQGAAHVLKVPCRVGGATAPSRGASPSPQPPTPQAPRHSSGSWLDCGLPHPGVANIATTGSPTEFVNVVQPQALSLWLVTGRVDSCGSANPSPFKTSVDLVLNEQNSKVSAIQHAAQASLGLSSLSSSRGHPPLQKLARLLAACSGRPLSARGVPSPSGCCRHRPQRRNCACPKAP